ncbi:hypothetical protein E2C01_061907 [Portunus trituberculatus]|uniref:RNase H type-1 domain-containing protein n=1 Tax=Portunus trituberculatus TaxID=210409 RepID=A0A5B7HGL8_PORTR|nr:hypothetical protein [Portunus trituberculatus]
MSYKIQPFVSHWEHLSPPVCALQAEASLPSLSYRRSSFLVRTYDYTKLASSPRCHALHSLLLRHSREPLHGPLPYQAHTPFVDRAVSFFGTLQSLCPFTHPHNSPKLAAQCRAELYSPHSSTHSTTTTFTSTPMATASLTLHPLVQSVIYIPSRSLATDWRLPATASITTAEMFAIKEGLQFATTLAAPCSLSLFSDSFSTLQIIKSHRPHSHHNLTLIIHRLILQLTSLGHTIHLQWVPAHVSVIGNTVADRAVAEAHTHPSSTDLATDQTDFLTDPKTVCRRHYNLTVTNALHHTSLGHIRQDTRHHWWTDSPNRALETAVTRLRIGHTHLNSHLHRIGMTISPHCPWCHTTQPDTPERLLLHCPHHHSHSAALLHSLPAIQPHRPTLTDLLDGCTNTTLAFKTLNLTRTFLQKTNHLQCI